MLKVAGHPARAELVYVVCRNVGAWYIYYSDRTKAIKMVNGGKASPGVVIGREYGMEILLSRWERPYILHSRYGLGIFPFGCSKRVCEV